ncbi:alanine:cation symporter family protein, partial [Pseudomonas aeruginosa]
MALFYLIIAVIILGLHIDMIPSVIHRIVQSAFSFDAAAGGMFGALVSKAMMIGLKRGLFSYEAGMGSAPHSAAAAHVKHPVSQGLV